jgi:hypothetical protein
LVSSHKRGKKKKKEYAQCVREALGREMLREAAACMTPLLEDVCENPRIVGHEMAGRLRREEQRSLSSLATLVEQQDTLHDRLTRAGEKKRQLSARIRAERDSGEKKRAALGGGGREKKRRR